MSLECLWAPWRMEFIQGCKPMGCFICAAAASDQDRENLVVRRRPRALCILNRYPYNNGHLLIAPLRHEGKLECLTAEELQEIMALLVESKRLIDRTMAPQGYNVGVNLGRVAGAGLEEHFHMHIVPRWSGDTNFMTSLGSTKVIPQALEELWNLLNQAWRSMDEEGR